MVLICQCVKRKKSQSFKLTLFKKERFCGESAVFSLNLVLNIPLNYYFVNVFLKNFQEKIPGGYRGFLRKDLVLLGSCTNFVIHLNIIYIAILLLCQLNFPLLEKIVGGPNPLKMEAFLIRQK